MGACGMRCWMHACTRTEKCPSMHNYFIRSIISKLGVQNIIDFNARACAPLQFARWSVLTNGIPGAMLNA